MPEGTRLYLLAPIVRGRKGEYRKELPELQKRGFPAGQDRRQDVRDRRGRRRSTRSSSTTSTVVVDRDRRAPDLGNRLADSFETALGLADGHRDHRERRYRRARRSSRRKFACPVSGFTIPEIEPRLFSFNNPFGACPACDGLGTKLYFDPDLVVHDDRPHASPRARSARGRIRRRHITCRRWKASPGTSRQSMHTPWRDLPEKMRQTILYGSRRRADRA